MTEPGGDRVLTVQSAGHTNVADLLPAAQRVAKECRRLHFEGYDLASFEVKAYMARDDRPLKVGGK